jgi:lysophospholipase L1-like esterase
VGVLNLGIGGTLVTTSGLARYQEDLLGQSGLRWIIVFYGVNDIGADLPASAITEAYQQIIREARAAGVKIYGATITPFQGHSYYTPAREAVRNEVNTWIRTFGNFDACIDFDLAIRDPQNPLRLMPAFSNDGLHPSVAGYEWLGKSVNPALFMEPGKKRVQGKKRK